MKLMFFRRQRVQTPPLAERLEALKRQGFEVLEKPAGYLIAHLGCALMASPESGGAISVGQPGLLLEGEVAGLTDNGYQKSFRARSGRKITATAAHLRALHEFELDVRDALGEESLYNQCLGTVSGRYLYDRVQDRDGGVPRRAWES
jgi:hypothetical protein